MVNRMDFEFDPRKSRSNLKKHGIDFDEATEFKGERRLLGMGRLSGEYWSVIYTRRGDRVRIISVRRSTPRERSFYDKAVNDGGT